MKANSGISFRNLVYRRDDDKLKCLICGQWFSNLSVHIWRTHKISVRDYKIKFGLDLNQGLISNKIKEIKRQQAYKYKTYEKNLVKDGTSTRFKKGEKRIGDYKRSDQTLERLKLLNTYRNK